LLLIPLSEIKNKKSIDVQKLELLDIFYELHFQIFYFRLGLALGCGLDAAGSGVFLNSKESEALTYS